MSWFDLAVVFCIGQYPVTPNWDAIDDSYPKLQRKAQVSCIKELKGCLVATQGKADIKDPWEWCTKDIGK